MRQTTTPVRARAADQAAMLAHQAPQRGPAHADGPDAMTRLAAAQARFEQGLLSPEEYDALRMEILGPVIAMAWSLL